MGYVVLWNTEKMYHGGSWPEAPQFTSGKSCPRIWSHPSDVTILTPEKPRRKVRMLLQRRVWMIFSDCLMFYNSTAIVPYNSVVWCDQSLNWTTWHHYILDIIQMHILDIPNGDIKVGLLQMTLNGGKIWVFLQHPDGYCSSALWRE